MIERKREVLCILREKIITTQKCTISEHIQTEEKISAVMGCTTRTVKVKVIKNLQGVYICMLSEKKLPSLPIDFIFHASLACWTHCAPQLWNFRKAKWLYGWFFPRCLPSKRCHLSVWARRGVPISDVKLRVIFYVASCLQQNINWIVTQWRLKSRMHCWSTCIGKAKQLFKKKFCRVSWVVIFIGKLFGFDRGSRD